MQAVDLEVVQAVSSRMFDPMPPSIGYFAFAGERYRRICGHSAEETVIDATLALARTRRDVDEVVDPGARPSHCDLLGASASFVRAPVMPRRWRSGPQARPSSHAAGVSQRSGLLPPSSYHATR